MLTRRGFAGVATCAICAAAGFIATDASAQNAPLAVTPGLESYWRKWTVRYRAM
jgi:hypothetical protein